MPDGITIPYQRRQCVSGSGDHEDEIQREELKQNFLPNANILRLICSSMSLNTTLSSQMDINQIKTISFDNAISSKSFINCASIKKLEFRLIMNAHPKCLKLFF